MQNFKQVLEVMKRDYKENNFCTVASIATAFDWSAGKAHRLMKKHGRPHRSGPSWYGFQRALEDAAQKAERDIEWMDFEGVTINRFRKAHPTGVYIIAVHRHVLTLRDGEFQDWTEDTAGKRKIRACFTDDKGHWFGVAKIN